MEQELKEQAEKEGKPVSFESLPPVATKGEIRREMLKEVLFVAIPLVLAIIAPLVLLKVGHLRDWWLEIVRPGTWTSGLLGSLWGAIVAASLIWIVRIGGTMALGRVAMGQGDTHLMVAIGAVMGAGPSVVVFFLAPFCGIIIGLYKWIMRGKHELPYGPYLSLAACVVLLGYRFVYDQFGLPADIVGQKIAEWFGA
jgi:leader peptidase (prepilin peptidase)/N-methyltransferase